jgi:ribonuclease HI
MNWTDFIHSESIFNKLLSFLPCCENLSSLCDNSPFVYPPYNEYKVVCAPANYNDKNYCDGSFDPQKGGAAAIAIIKYGIAHCFSWKIAPVSSFYSELISLIFLLKKIEDFGSINPVIFVDCAALVYITNKILNSNFPSKFTTFIKEKTELFGLIKKLNPSILKIKGHSNDFGNEMVNQCAQNINKTSLKINRPMPLSGKIPSNLTKYFKECKPIFDNVWSFWWCKKKFSLKLFKWAHQLYSNKNYSPHLWSSQAIQCKLCHNSHKSSLLQCLLFCKFWVNELETLLHSRKLSRNHPKWTHMSTEDKILFLRGFHPKSLLISATTLDSVNNWSSTIEKILVKAEMNFTRKRKYNGEVNKIVKRNRLI